MQRKCDLNISDTLTSFFNLFQFSA